MIKLLVILILLLPSQQKELRSLFKQAYSKESAAIQLKESAEKESSIVGGGYYGVAQMLLARHAINPFSKMKLFSTGKTILENAIAVDSTNVELRYLRFTIQTNVPKLLGYSDNIENDRKYLTEQLNELYDKELKEMIQDYLKNNL